MTYFYNYFISKKETSIDCNFIKPHMALDGKTPSEMAGITIDGDNKWLSLMKTALWYKKTHVGGV